MRRAECNRLFVKLATMNLQTIHHLARRSAVAVEARHEILQLHFVLLLRFEDEDLDGPEALRRDAATFDIDRLSDRLEKG
jgi:hypothetical protein